MNLLATLTLAADEEQLRLRPLPEHAAASQPEHLRQHYALLLAAVLTAQPAVSEPQTRLFRLLLDSLMLGDIRGQLFEQARELEPAPLIEAARLIREAGFAHHLLVDVLVLQRLDTPLTEEAARLAGELTAFLGLEEADLATRAGDASEILGLNADKTDGEDATGTPAIQNMTLAELWPGKPRQALTSKALRAGLQGGLWMLDSNLDVNFPWQANDAILFFRNDAVLNTIVATKGETKLTGCRLANAVLDFQGKSSITLERCDWQGSYNPGLKRTALNSIDQEVTITGCQFSTRNARSIMVKDNTLTLTGSSFTHCGHPQLDGGAIWHSDRNRKIENCRFDRCVAACGGAFWVNALYGVNQCEFFACESQALQNKGAGDVAVYAYEARAKTAISNCVFRQTSLAIGSAFDGSSAEFVHSTQFWRANIYYHNKYSCNSISVNCNFVDGLKIEKKL